MKAPGSDVDPYETGRLLGWNATTTPRALAGVVDALRNYSAEIQKPPPRSPDLPPLRMPIGQHTTPNPNALPAAFAQRNRLGIELTAPNPARWSAGYPKAPIAASSPPWRDKLDPSNRFLGDDAPNDPSPGAETNSWRDKLLLKAAQSIAAAGRKSAANGG